MTRRNPISSFLVPALALLIAVIAFAVFTSAAPARKQAHGRGHHHKHSHHKQPPKPPKSFYGIVPQAPIDETDMAEMKATGISVLRSAFYWQTVQPTDGSTFNFDRYDDLVRKAATQGLTVLPYVYGTPDWVAKTLDDRNCGADCDQYAPRSAEALAAWTNFTSALAARYGPDGNFWTDPANASVPYKPIRNWQIWNEENSKMFYLPKPDPKKYSKLLAAAAQGIRSQDPNADIILGGTFGLPKKNGKHDPDAAIPASTFVQDLLKQSGAKKNFDGVGLHPYSGGLDFVKKQATVMRAALRKSHYSDAELWITETGAASGGPKSSLNLGSKKAQAKRVTDTYKLFTQHRKDWNVKLVAWFSWQDVPAADSKCFFCQKTGLLDTSGNAKPSLTAYKQAAK